MQTAVCSVLIIDHASKRFDLSTLETKDLPLNTSLFFRCGSVSVPGR